jgi:hypothetical protein
MSEKQFTTPEEIANVHDLCREFHLNGKHQAVLFLSLTKKDPESEENQLLCSLQGSNKTIRTALIAMMAEDDNIMQMIKQAVSDAMLIKLTNLVSDEDDSE